MPKKIWSANRVELVSMDQSRSGIIPFQRLAAGEAINESFESD